MNQTYTQALQQFTAAVATNQEGEGFGVYRNNALLGKVNAVVGNYPVVKRLLPDPVFMALSHAYAKNVKSQHWDINLYGSGFAGFLQAQLNGPKKDAFNWLAIAAVAKIEYILLNIYYQQARTEHIDVDLLKSLYDDLPLFIECHAYADFTAFNTVGFNAVAFNTEGGIKVAVSQLTGRVTLASIRQA